jgi:hypothetical protein
MAYWLSDNETDEVVYPAIVPWREPGADWGSGHSLNASNKQMAYQFYVHRACNLSSFKICLKTVTNGGSLSPSDIVFELYSTNTDRSVGSKIADLGTLPDLNTGIKTITPSNPPTLSANTIYTIIVRNINASPASNYVTIQWRMGSPLAYPPSSYYLSYYRAGHYDGTSWTWTAPYSSFPNFEYTLTEDSDTRNYGFVLSDSYAAYDITSVGRVIAIQLSLPVPAYLLGVRAYFYSISGARTDTLRLKVCDSSGNTLHNADAIMYYGGTNTLNIELPSPYQLQANTQYRIGIEKVSGTNTVSMRVLDYYGSRAFPAVYYYSGSSWSLLSGKIAPMGLLLQPISSGGGQSVLPPLHRIIS